jgi:hypothetical protein
VELRQRFVLDTTAFTGFQRKKDACEWMGDILDLIATARIKLNISCHIPFPTVYDELKQLLGEYGCGEELLIKADTWLVKKTPNRIDVKIAAEIFYDYIKDMRTRMNRAMKVAEGSIWLAAEEARKLTIKGKDKEEIERESTGFIISNFRDKYRNALRYGTLDSAPDLDVLLLATEMNAGVVARDEGIKIWAERLGLRYVDGMSFPGMLREYLRHVK